MCLTACTRVRGSPERSRSAGPRTLGGAWNRLHRIARSLAVLFLPALLVLATVSPCAGADGGALTIKVRAEGFAEGQGSGARAEALALAEEAAVMTLIEDLVPPRWLDSLDAVYAQLTSYVRTSRPVEIDRLPEGTNVYAEVYIHVQQLRRDLAASIFAELPVKPRVVFLVGEHVDAVRDWHIGSEGYAVSALSRHYASAGFEVVDADSLEGYVAEDLMRRHSGGIAGLGLFGRDIGADIVLRGNSRCALKRVSGSQNAVDFHASLRVELINVIGGSLLETFSSEARVSSAEPALGARQAVEDAVVKVIRDAMVTTVLGFVSAPRERSYLLRVSVPARGAWRGRIGRELRKRLRGATVHDLQHRARESRFQVEYEGDLGDLVHTLSDSGYEGFTLEVRSAAGRDVHVSVVVPEEN